VISRPSFPEPVPGLVVRYSYLWHSEHVAGQEKGRKDRPCAVVLSLLDGEGLQRVVVLPITHTPPSASERAVEVPYNTKRRLGLDSDRSWVVLSEANLFSWPGPDLRPAVNGDLSTIAYGLLPRSLFYETRDGFANAFRYGSIRMVPRTK
jgi:hypothetical protein